MFLTPSSRASVAAAGTQFPKVQSLFWADVGLGWGAWSGACERSSKVGQVPIPTLASPFLTQCRAQGDRPTPSGTGQGSGHGSGRNSYPLGAFIRDFILGVRARCCLCRGARTLGTGGVKVAVLPGGIQINCI